MTIGNPAPSIELELIPFIPSREQAVANLDTILFDKRKKRIVMRLEKRINTGDQPVEITVTEKTILQGKNKDPKLLAMSGVAAALANVDNVSKLVEDADRYQEKMSQINKTLRK